MPLSYLRKRSGRMNRLHLQASASLYGLYISLLVAIGGIGFLSNVGNAVRISSTSQVDAKMQIMADASLDIASAQLDEIILRSAANNNDQGDWRDIFEIENAVLGIFNQVKGDYKALNINGAEVKVNLTDLPDKVYDSSEMTAEEIREYAKQNGLGESEFIIDKEAMLEAVVKIGNREVYVTKEVGHEHKHQAKFYGVDLKGKSVFIIDRSGSMTTKDQLMLSLEDWNGNLVMNPDRMTLMRTKVIQAIRELEMPDKFAVIDFGNSSTHWNLGKLSPTDELRKIGAENYISAFTPEGLSPMSTALEFTCSFYQGDEPTRFFLLSDGMPNETIQYPQTTEGVSHLDVNHILTNFPSWYQRFRDYGCKLYCVHVGPQGGDGEDFMRNLASNNGGAYIWAYE